MSAVTARAVVPVEGPQVNVPGGAAGRTAHPQEPISRAPVGLVPRPIPRLGGDDGGHVLRILNAEATEPTHGGHALLKGCEPAVRAALKLAAQRAPRIILVPSTKSKILMAGLPALRWY
jgi:hypothetical protein